MSITKDKIKHAEKNKEIKENKKKKKRKEILSI